MQLQPAENRAARSFGIADLQPMIAAERHEVRGREERALSALEGTLGRAQNQNRRPDRKRGGLYGVYEDDSTRTGAVRRGARDHELAAPGMPNPYVITGPTRSHRGDDVASHRSELPSRSLGTPTVPWKVDGDDMRS